MRHRPTLATILILGLLATDLLGLAASARAEEFLDDRLGVRVAPILLLTRRDVQADLKLDSDTAAEADHASEALYRQALNLRGKAGPAIVQARRNIDEEQSQWLTTHLTPAQIERLAEIDLQWEGASAMISRPIMVETLGLSEKQKTTLGQFVQQGKDLRKIRRWSSREHAALSQKAMEVLSDRQRMVWNRLLGSPCRFSIAERTASRPPSPAQSAR